MTMLDVVLLFLAIITASAAVTAAARAGDIIDLLREISSELRMMNR